LFGVVLPMSASGPGLPSRSERLPRALVIDDDPNFLKLMQTVLGLQRFEVLTALDGRRGMTVFRAQAPDITIVDVLMPVQDGIETIIAMRRERPFASILAISAGGHIAPSHYLTAAVKLGANMAIEKPLDFKKLLVALRTLLARETPSAMTA